MGELLGLDLHGLDFLRTRTVSVHQQLISLSPLPLHPGPVKTAESPRDPAGLIASGESVKVVQRRPGHSTAVVTLGTHAHLWPDSDDRTRSAIATALSATADSVRTESG